MHRVGRILAGRAPSALFSTELEARCPHNPKTATETVPHPDTTSWRKPRFRNPKMLRIGNGLHVQSFRGSHSLRQFLTAHLSSEKGLNPSAEVIRCDWGREELEDEKNLSQSFRGSHSLRPHQVARYKSCEKVSILPRKSFVATIRRLHRQINQRSQSFRGSHSLRQRRFWGLDFQ